MIMRTRHLTAVGLLASVLAVGLITGCAQGSGSPSGDGSASGGPSAAPSASASAPGGGSIAPQSPPPSGGASHGSASGELTLTGPIEAGAEPSCLIMRSNGSTYQLIGGDKNIVKAGSTVTVTGHVVTGVMSYCMQGKIFQVTQAHIN